MTKGFSFTWLALTYYGKKACVQPILHLHTKYKQLWTASYLNWQNYHLMSANISQRNLWEKKTECSKPTCPPIIAMEPCSKAHDPTNSQKSEMSVRWSKAFPCRLPWPCLAFSTACPQQPRGEEGFCSSLCFHPGWMPGVQCVHNSFNETDGN